MFLRNSLIFCQQLFHPTTFRNCTLHNLARLSMCGDDVAAAGDTAAYGDDGDGVMIARQQSNQWNRVSACKVLEKERKEKKKKKKAREEMLTFSEKGKRTNCYFCRDELRVFFALPLQNRSWPRSLIYLFLKINLSPLKSISCRVCC